MKASRTFTFFAIADKEGNTAICVCDKLNDLVNIEGLVDSEGEPLYFFERAEYLPMWAVELGFKCHVVKRLIEVEIP